MTAISTSVPLDWVSAIVGYGIEGSLEGVDLGFLPQAIDIIAEVSTGAFQPSEAEAFEFTTAKQVGDRYGNDNPAYLAARILRPITGDKLGSIKTRILTVLEDAAPTACVSTTTITGTATANTTHTLRINGRTSLDGQAYSFNILKGDDAADIAEKMANAVNRVYGCPGTGAESTGDFVLTSGWKGATAVLNVEVEVGDVDAGITYATSKVDGTGQLTTALTVGGTNNVLDLISDRWTTMIINCLAPSADNLNAYELWNGNPNSKTGRYLANVFKPAMVFSGDNSINTLGGCTTLTDGRKAETTNVFCPAPNSANFDFETAANVVYDFSYIAHKSPSIDPMKTLLNEITIGDTIGDFSNPTQRNEIIKVGSSTVKRNDTKYEIVDLVTTYHPDDEPDTASLFRYARDLICDWQIRYAYKLLENQYVVGKTIISDSDVSSAPNTISPKRWRGILKKKFAPSLINNGIIADQTFFNDNVQVQISSTNPNRFETNFKVKRTSVSRIQSTTAVTQFNF